MFCYVIGRKSLDNATLYDKLFFVVLAVGVDQCLFIILVEELLVSKRLDLCDDLGVVVCPSNALTVLKGGLCV